MFHLILAIISSALITIIMRISTNRVSGNLCMLAMNYLMCFLLASLYTGIGQFFPGQKGLISTLIMGFVNGFLYLGGFVLLQFNVKKNGVVLSSTFMKLGLLVPLLISMVIFHEKPQLLQILGFITAIAAIVLMNFERESTVVQFKSGLILILIAGGSGDAMSKIFEEIGQAEMSAQFLLYTFAVAFILCMILAIAKKEHIGWKEILFGFLIGIPNFYSAQFLLRALQSLDAVIVYPTFSVGTILVVTMTGVLFFKEKLGKKQWTALGGILIALVLLNI